MPSCNRDPPPPEDDLRVTAVLLLDFLLLLPVAFFAIVISRCFALNAQLAAACWYPLVQSIPAGDGKDWGRA